MKTAGLKILQTGLLFTLVLSPLLFGSVHDWSSMFFCGVLFLLFFLNPGALDAAQTLPFYFKASVAAVFILIAAQALFFSPDMVVTRRELLKWLACAVAFLLVQKMPLESRKSLFWAVIGVALLEAFYGLFQTLGGHSRVLWRVQEAHFGFATGTFINRNHLAGLLEMALGIQLGYLLQSMRGRQKPAFFLALAGLLVTLTVLVKTGSRMGLISFVISAFVSCVFLFFRKGIRSMPVFIILVAAAGAAAFVLGRHEITSRFSDGAFWEQSWGGRNIAWRDTLRMIMDYFWQGSGLGTYEWVFPRYQSPELLMGWNHAHSDFLELAAELGLPVFIIWVSSLVFFIFRSFLAAAKDEKTFPLVWGIFCGLLSFLIHGLADFNWTMASHAFWFFVLLSALHGYSVREPARENSKPQWRRIVQAFALILLALAGQKALAGTGEYAAMRALQYQDFQRAAGSAEKALMIAPWNSQLRLQYGQAALAMGKKNKNLKWLEAAEDSFARVTREKPWYGRAWLYLALSKIALTRLSGETMTPEKWGQIKNYFNEALNLEPGSAWISFVTSVHLLNRPQFLGPVEKGRTVERLRSALSLHYEGQRSRFLVPAIEFLWKRTRDFDLLIQITPKDYAAYWTLLGFVEKSGLWQHRNQINPEFLKLREAAYSQELARAERLLGKGKKREAFEAFQRSWWMDQGPASAKSGMLRARQGKHLYSADQERQWLLEILEQEEEHVPALAAIGQVVRETDDDYIKGLWAYRAGKWREALERLEADKETYSRTVRWRAASYAQLGQKEKALELLSAAAKEENPDIRDLVLLKQLDPLNQEANVKISQIQKRSSAQPVEKSGDMGVWVNLLPGTSEIKIPMKSTAHEGIYAYVRFSLNEGGRTREAGSAYVDSEKWGLYSFTIRSSGGICWLAIAQPNKAAAGGEGPEAEFGPLKIVSVK